MIFITLCDLAFTLLYDSLQLGSWVRGFACGVIVAAWIAYLGFRKG